MWILTAVGRKYHYQAHLALISDSRLVSERPAPCKLWVVCPMERSNPVVTSSAAEALRQPGTTAEDMEWREFIVAYRPNRHVHAWR